MRTDKIIAEKIASEYAPRQDRKVIALIKLNRKESVEMISYILNFWLCSHFIRRTAKTLSVCKYNLQSIAIQS